jgi:AcrR family transcriptional regulator
MDADTPTSSRERAPRGEGDRLREQLLEAATDLVHEEGGAERLSIRQVTKRAGVSPMALYLHFASLDHLVAALIDHGFERFREVLHAAAEAAGDVTPRERLGAIGVAYMRFAREEPALYGVIFGPHHPAGDAENAPGESGVGMEAFQDLVDAITACQEAGEARAGDPRELAIGVWSTMHGFATLCHAHDHDDLPWPDDATFAAALYEAWLAERV